MIKNRKKLHVAFIGAGSISELHMRCYKDMDDVKMVAMADISKDNLSKRAEDFGISNCFTDYKEMLRKVKPEAVSICTPNNLHASSTISSLRAGAHVLVEKPLALNVREGQRMLQASKKYRRKLIIGFQHRFEPKSQFIKKAVANGQIGRVLFARVQALRRRGIPNWGVFGRKEMQGGGPLIDIGVHVLEVTHYVMGSPNPVIASGNTFTYLGNKKSNVVSKWPDWNHKNYTVEDLCIGQIRFENGAILHIETSFAAHIEKDVWNFQIMGEKGGVTWDPPMIVHDDYDHMVNTYPGWLPSSDFKSCFETKMRNFVDHVLYNRPTIAPVEHGLIVQKMMDGIYASAEKGKEVKIS